MVYLYRKDKGGKSYYYLRASVKKNGKQQTKDIAYLGDDPSRIRERLEDLPARYADDIRKSYKTIERFLQANYAQEQAKQEKPRTDDYLGKETTLDVEACRYHFQHAFSRLDERTKDEILQNFIIEFSFNTTSLEGNTITLQEASRLLLEQRTPKNKTLREVHDVQNTSAVFNWLYDGKPALTHELIQDVHRRLLAGVDGRVGYRAQDIRVYRSHFDATPGPYVRTDMESLLRWHEEHDGKLHPLVSATLFHHKFEKIHPFMDGNGRTGRMLANLILLRHTYPPLIITKKRRDAYLRALGKADRVGLGDDDREAYAPLVSFTAEEYVRNYWNVFL
ncbi:Fic family protein [Candidatus Woesearchaeota archaeon]|nr:Fic family protein [Candidatus Woesearchaeota archaeon]